MSYNNNMMSNTKDFEYKATNMDDRLKELAAEKFKEAIEFAVQGHDIECFRCYKALFHMIEPYEFDSKHELLDITEVITNYVKSLAGKPINKMMQINVKNTQYTIRDLLQVYMSKIPAAFSELGLWFRIIQYHHDTDKYVSKQFFNDEMSLLGKKKTELLKVPTKELLEYMRPQHIHQTYARYRIENAK